MSMSLNQRGYRIRKTPSAPREADIAPHPRPNTPPPSYDSLFPSDFSSDNESFSDNEVFHSSVEHHGSLEHLMREIADRTERLSTPNSEYTDNGCHYPVDEFPMVHHVNHSRRLSSEGYHGMESTNVSSRRVSHHQKGHRNCNGYNNRRSRRHRDLDRDQIAEAEGNTNSDQERLECALLPSLSLEQAKETILCHWQRHWYNITGCKNIQIMRIVTSCVWQYYMETILEQRFERHREEPFIKGSFVENPESFPPSIWKVKVDMPKSLNTRRARIPNTSSVEECHYCSGRGYSSCLKCNGTGKFLCDYCGESGQIAFHVSRTIINQATGQRESKPVIRRECCNHCSGVGKMECTSCRAKCRTPCTHCMESGQLEKFSEVVVKWLVKPTHYFTKTSQEFSPDILMQRRGIVVYENGNKNGEIEPMSTSDCLNKEIIAASKRCNRIHKEAASGLPIRQQRHCVQLIPINKVICRKGRKIKAYWLAGTDNHVCFSREIDSF